MPSVRSWFIKQFVRLRIKSLLKPGVAFRKVRGRTNYLASYGWYPFLVRRERFRIGEIDVAAYAPKRAEPRGTILFVHGGGFCFGSIRMYGDLAARLAAAAQARVVLPEYRLAPEHRYPTAHDDVMRVYEQLVSADERPPCDALAPGPSPEGRGGGKRGEWAATARPSQFTIVGDSAGGGLALATLVAARERGLPLPAAVGVISPWTDLSCDGPTYVENAERDPMLPTEIVRRCAAEYSQGADRLDSRLSPLHADLSGLPPLLIQVGTEEILLSDSTRLADAARAAGVDVTLHVYGGMWHVWHMFAWAVPEGKAAIRELGRFLREAMDGASGEAPAEAHSSRTEVMG